MKSIDFFGEIGCRDLEIYFEQSSSFIIFFNGVVLFLEKYMQIDSRTKIYNRLSTELYDECQLYNPVKFSVSKKYWKNYQNPLHDLTYYNLRI